MNPWDRLVDVFGSGWKGKEASAALADNILIAWPSILRGIRNHFGTTEGLKVLDFGCGGGQFCRALHQLNNEVTGYEPSEALFKAACRNVPKGVSITDSHTIFRATAEYDVISSIMVFQFIPEVDPVIDRLINVLKPGGLLIFAVFNPSFVFDPRNQNGLFSGTCAQKKTTTMVLQSNVEIPVTIRDRTDYCRLFADQDFEEVYYDSPPFTKEFITAFDAPFSTDESEFLIQAFTQRVSWSRAVSGTG